MANRDGREALRGAGEETLDVLSEILTSEEWAIFLRTPLEVAAAQGNRGFAQKLVEAGAEMGKALHEAVLGDHQEIVNDLLEGGASIDAKDKNGSTPLHLAAREGKLAIVQLLILKGADKDAMDSRQKTPLYLAVGRRHEAAALALLAGRADVNRRCTSENESVLHIAAIVDLPELLRAAIGHGAEIDAANIDKHTALHFAATESEAEVVDALVGAGADVEATDDTGRTPLHCAAGAGSLEAVMALLKHGADVNAEDCDSETPLHYAAVGGTGTRGTAEVIEYLLKSGADETVLDDDGYIASDLVGLNVSDEGKLAEDVERVRQLLRNAPADRAWRRRGYLVLCRAQPDRVQVVQESSGAPAGVGRNTRNSAKLARTQASGSGTSDGRAYDDDWISLVSTLLGLQEEGIFRTIIRFL